MKFSSVDSIFARRRTTPSFFLVCALAGLSACSSDSDSGGSDGVNDDSFAFATEGTVNVPASRGVLSNDGSDFDSVAILSGLSSGSTLSLFSDGSFTYSPASGVSQESFTYTATDGDSTEQGTVTLYVLNGTSACSEVNVATSSSSIKLAPTGLTASHGVTFSLTSQSAKGTLSGLDSSTGQATFTYAGAARGRDAVGVTVSDDFGNTLSYDHALGLYPVRIMPLGDSITQGIEDSSTGSDTPVLSQRDGYRMDLYELLNGDDYAFDLVGGESAGGALFSDSQHEGHPGYTDYELAGTADPDGTNSEGAFNASTDGVYNWLSDNQADLLLIHAGTNNVRLRTSTVGLELLLDELDRWEGDFGWPVEALVAKIIDKNRTPDDHSNVLTYNSNVQSLVEARISSGDDLTLVDIYSAVGAAVDANGNIINNDVLSTDGTHPTPGAYSRMADGWKAAIDNDPLLVGKCN